MTARSTLPALAAAVGLHVFLSTCSDAALGISAPAMVKSDRPAPADGFDNGCNAATPLWARVRTKTLCAPPAVTVTPVNTAVQRSAQATSSGGTDDTDDAVPGPEWAMLGGEDGPEMPLGVTDGLQPEAVGQSRRLYRCTVATAAASVVCTRASTMRRSRGGRRRLLRWSDCGRVSYSCILRLPGQCGRA